MWAKPALPLTAEEWLPVRSFWQRGITLKDGREVRLLEVGSLHLRLRSPAERKRILRAEEELFNSLRFSLMRLALPVPVDLGQYTKEVIARLEGETNSARGSLLLDKLGHVQQLITDRHLVQWRNLVVIPGPKPSPEASELPLAERVQLVRGGLERAGLPVHELGPFETARVWQALLSPTGSVALSYEDLEHDLLEQITPQHGFDFTPPQHFRVGAQFARIIALTGYPRQVTPAHFGDLYRLDRRVTVVQHVHPTDSVDLQREISNSIGEMQARLGAPLSEYEKEATKARLRDAQRLLRKLAGENHRVLDLCTYLLLRADVLTNWKA